MYQFFAVGINFKNADINTRSAFSLNETQQATCFELAKKAQLKDFIIVSTCNRTEVYFTAPSPDIVEDIICSVSQQPKEIFEKVKFVKEAKDAVRHIFNVAAGLDSQILGDYEILGQFKTACKLAKKHLLLSNVVERLVNTVIQASKEVKSSTALSKGTVSASYAAIELLKLHFQDQAAKILLVGTGQFGQKIAKNIVNYCPNLQLTLTNRTNAKAQEIAKQLGVSVIDFHQIATDAQNYDAIVLCATSNNYILEPIFFNNSKQHLILDLSVPSAANPTLKNKKRIKLFDIDNISVLLNNTLENRKLYLPIAINILSKYETQFFEWHKIHKHRHFIHDLKQKLYNLSKECPHLSEEKNELIVKKKINKAITLLVQLLKQNNFQLSQMDTEQVVHFFMTYTHPLEKKYLEQKTH